MSHRANMLHSAKRGRTIRRGLLALVLMAALIVPLVRAPSVALAASPADLRRPHFGPRMHRGPGRMIHPFWMTGEVEEVAEGSVKLLLEGRGHEHPMLRQFEWSVTLAVDEDSILLDGAFNPVDLAALEVGTPVVFVPRMIWGTLGVRLLYAGSPKDLSDATYIGRATVVDENTLRVEGWHSDVTVVVDDATIWYDDGKRGRPAELYDNTLVRVIGVEEQATGAASTADDRAQEATAATVEATPTAAPEEEGATAEATATATAVPTVRAAEEITSTGVLTEEVNAGETAGAAEDEGAAEADSMRRRGDETVVRAVLITPGRRGF